MEKYEKLAEGVEALIKLHKADTKEIAKYLSQYVDMREDKPFWAKEYELMEARNNLERDCWEADNLYDAIMVGGNMTYLDNQEVGYIGEDGELQLYDNYEGYSVDDLKKTEVEFDTLDRDEDGYTITRFTKRGE